MLGEPADEEFADFAGEEVDTPAGAAQAAGPDGTTPTTEPAGTTVVDEGDEIDLDNVPEPEERADGKWALGKYVADTPLELLKVVERARRHAESDRGRAAQVLDPTANPFLEHEGGEGEEEDEGLEVVDEITIGNELGAGIAQALLQHGLVQPPQVDPQVAAAQAVAIADQAIGNPATTGTEFRAVLTSLMTHNPFDIQTRERVLSAWGDVEPYAAAREGLLIEQALLEVQREQQSLEQQAHQQAIAAQEAADAEAFEQSTTAAQEALPSAQQAWAERHEGWEAHNDGMNAYIAGNKRAWDRTVASGDAAAIYDFFDAAFQHATLAAQVAGGVPGGGAAAGIAQGAPEHAGTMQGMAGTPHVDPAALHRANVAQSRDEAGMEMGVTDDVEVTVLSTTNPAGIAEQSTEDLLGMQATQ